MPLFNFTRVIDLFKNQLSKDNQRQNQYRRQFSPERYMTALNDEEEREREIDEMRKQEEADKTSLVKYVSSLITSNQFEKTRPFLLGDGSEQFHQNLNRSVYVELLQSIPQMLLSKHKNDIELNALLDIVNDPSIMKKSLRILHSEFEAMARTDYDMFDNYYRVLFTHPLENDYSDYLKITQKMFSFDHKDDTLTYLGMSNLSDIEKKLINTQFAMLESLHDGVDFMKPYNHPESKLIPCNDLVLLAFLNEKPQYHGSPILLNNDVVVSKFGTLSFLNEKYKTHYNKNLEISIIREKADNCLETYMKAFKQGGISDNIQEEYLKKFQKVMGNDMDKALSEIEIPSLFEAKLLKKYSEIINLEKIHKDEDFKSFLNASKKSLINFVHFYPSLSSVQNTEEIKEVLTSLIQKIDTNIETLQVETISNFQTNQSIHTKVLKA